MHIKLTNNIPEAYSIGQLRRDNPQVSFPQNIPEPTLAEYSVYPLTPADQPVYDSTTHRIEEGTPVQIDGVWTQAWNVIALTDEEVAQQQVELQQNIVAQTQQRLDSFANTRNYDGILSLCTYATSTVTKFQAEGQYGVEARDATWAKLYEIMAEVQVGTRPMPTGFADIEADLPTLTWPV